MTRRTPKEITLTVEELAGDGYGAAAVEGRTVRVKNGLVGETVTARVLKRRRGEWLAEAFDVSDRSASRVRPACGYFPRCGGCVLQHLSYSEQVLLKQSELLALLAAEGVSPVSVNEPTLGPRFHYRTKARFGVRLVGGQVLAGFRESFSNRVGRMDACITLTRELADLPAELKALIGSLSRPDRIPQVEIAAGDRDAALIIRHLEPFERSDLRRIASFAEARLLKCFGQSGGYDTLTPLNDAARDPLLGYANPELGLYFRFLPSDFTQVNLRMNRKLVSAALAALAAPPSSRVHDLFCGIGNFSLALARLGHPVSGIEASHGSVLRAIENASMNGLSGRCEFEMRDLYDPGCLDLGVMEYLLLDPPRSGAGPNLANWLASGRPKRVAYVSCGPQSFARDARVIVDHGYVLEQVGVFDMFPHTAHIETLGVFQRQW